MTKFSDKDSFGGKLLGAADIRRIAAEEGITPSKKFGQNFVIDPGTCLLYTSDAADE